MKTDILAKKIILYLTRLNIITILASVVIFSFNHAAVLAGVGCTPDQFDVSSVQFPTDNPTYSGALTTDAGVRLATLTLAFTGTPGNLRNVVVTFPQIDPPPSGVADFVGKLNPQWNSGTLVNMIFKVNNPNNHEAQLRLYNAAFHSGKTSIVGDWVINDGERIINQYDGHWNVTLDGSSSSKSCVPKQVNVSSIQFPTDNPTYSGTLTTDTGVRLATLTLAFTGTPGNLSNVVVTFPQIDPPPSGVADFVGKLNPQWNSGTLVNMIFKVNNPNNHEAQLRLYDAAFHSGKTSITGAWIIHDEQEKLIDQYDGHWNVTLQGSQVGVPPKVA